MTAVMKLTVLLQLLDHRVDTTSGRVTLATSAYPSHSSVTGRMIVRT